MERRPVLNPNPTNYIECQRKCDNADDCIGIEHNVTQNPTSCYILTGRGLNFRSTAIVATCRAATQDQNRGPYTCYRRLRRGKQAPFIQK